MISVIVPYLDEAPHLESCIRSLREQTIDCNDYELIFVDNGSRDGSANIVNRFPDIIALRHSPPNVYSARNKALQTARGRIIAFTDADCQVSREWLAEIRTAFRSPDVVIVLGRRLFPASAPTTLKLFEEYENVKTEYVISRGLKNHFFGYANNMAIRADAFGNHGLFNEQGVAADSEFVLKCVRDDPRSLVVYSPTMTIVHLEVSSARAWLDKVRSYGALNRRTPLHRTLTFRAKLAVAARTAASPGLGFLGKTILWPLLVLGNAFYVWGAWKGSTQRSSRAPSPGPSGDRPSRAGRFSGAPDGRRSSG
jgi:glycosyltransferase involved in cell wall biosynthesis